MLRLRNVRGQKGTTLSTLRQKMLKQENTTGKEEVTQSIRGKNVKHKNARKCDLLTT